MNPLDITDNMRQSESLVARYSNRDQLESAKSKINTRIADRTLHVMVCGAYNSGKSTLINALLKQERAPIGEVPTTDRVDFYDWNGYRLLDTPGVNAPIEHEKITAAQLERTNAIVVVVREGDQDVNDVYDRLFSMLAQRKSIFILMNHELASPEDVTMSISRISAILRQMATKKGVDSQALEKLPIYPVNLFTALNGLMRGSDRLVSHSGFKRFLDGFSHWTRRHASETHHLAEIKDTVKSLWYRPALHTLEEQIPQDQDQDQDLTALRRVEQALTTKMVRITELARGKVDREIDRIRPDISQLHREPADVEEADKRLNGLVAAITGRLQDWLSSELEETISIEAGPVSVAKRVVDGASETDSGTTSDLTLSKVTKSVIEEVSPIVTNDQTIKDLLLRLRGTKAFNIRDFLGLKGKWATTLGRNAVNISKWAGRGLWAAQLLMAGLDVKHAHAKQEETNQGRVQLATASYHGVASICEELRQEIITKAERDIRGVFEPRIEEIQAELSDKMHGEADQKKDYQKLLDYRNRLEQIGL